MKKISSKLFKLLFNIVFMAATISVNTTCYRKYYQEELNDQLDGLRKYKYE